MKRKTITFLISACAFMVAQGGQENTFNYCKALAVIKQPTLQEHVNSIPKTPPLTAHDLALLEKHSKTLGLLIDKETPPLANYCKKIVQPAPSESQNKQESSESGSNRSNQKSLPLAVPSRDPLTSSMLGIATVCFAVSLLDSNRIWQFFKKKY